MPRSPQQPSDGDGFVLCVCNGPRCTAAAEAGMGDVMDDLGEAVRRSPGGVLVRTGCLGVCTGEHGHLPLAVTHGYRDGRIDRPATPATWLGPVGDRRAAGLVRTWLLAGGPGRQPVPSKLRTLVLQPPRRADPTTN